MYVCTYIHTCIVSTPIATVVFDIEELTDTKGATMIAVAISCQVFEASKTFPCTL